MTGFILDSHATSYKKFADALETARNAQILAYGEIVSYKCKLFDELAWALENSWLESYFNKYINHIREVLRKKSKKSSIYRAYTTCFLPEEVMLEFIDSISTIKIMTDDLDGYDKSAYSKANAMITGYIWAQTSLNARLFIDDRESYLRNADRRYKELFG